jgi:hypothetical protein
MLSYKVYNPPSVEVLKTLPVDVIGEGPLGGRPPESVTDARPVGKK